MKKSPPKNEKPNEQEENIKKMWKEIPFYFWFPLLAGIIIIAFGGDLDIQFVVSTVILFGIGFLGIWLIYKAKRQNNSKENSKP